MSTHWFEIVKQVQQVEFAVGLSIAVWIAIKLTKTIRLRRREQAFGISGVDAMSGLEFELYVAHLLTNLGYNRVKLTETYDLGIDIIAQDEDIRWGVQVKRYNGLVKAEAVRQVVTALNIYGCDRSMVITNSHFSNQAVRLADSNNCVLIDRSKLIELVAEQDN